MLRTGLVFLVIAIAAQLAHAQTIFNGRVLENKTRIVLHGVVIENLGNKLKAVSGGDGRFSIAARAGDLLVFKIFSYRTDTVLVTDLHDREFFLTPQVNMLNQVTITDSSGRTSSAAKNMQLPYDPEFHGQTAVAHRDRNGDFDGGTVLRIHYFTKDDNDKKKAEKKDSDRKTSQSISDIFVADNISKFVPLKGVDMENFLLLYTPDVKAYKAKDFNLLSYLNTCYKAWLQLPLDKRSAGQLFIKP